MSRFARQGGVFLLLLGLFTVSQLPYGEYSHQSVERLEARARGLGVPVDIGTLGVSFPLRISVAPVGMLLPARVTQVGSVPVPLRLDSLEFRLSPLALFLLRLEGESKAVAYGGELLSDVRYSLFHRSLSVMLTAKDLELERYPVSASLNISGKVHGEGKLQVGESFESLDAHLRLSIKEGAYPGGVKIHGVVPVPAIQELNGEVVGGFKERAFSLEKLALSSSLGLVTGEGGVSFTPSGEPTASDLRFEIDLTPEGQRQLGGYLALAGGGRVDKPSSAWTAELAPNKTGALAWKVSPRG